MKINEFFYSIQGEGKWLGLPNIFIRTTGCNLRCSFCDTTYAYESGEEMSIGEIINRIQKYCCKYVCITGGEPLLHEDIMKLVDILMKKKYEICLETNGSIDIEKLVGKSSLFISLDIKCPSSNMHEKMNFNNVFLLTSDDQLKFIIQNKDDYEYAKKIIKKYKPQSAIFFQPVWGFDLKDIYQWILNDNLDVKLGFQFHKIIWGDRKRV
jgi:7-carboxy-7-deazaguanine synthase